MTGGGGGGLTHPVRLFMIEYSGAWTLLGFMLVRGHGRQKSNKKTKKRGGKGGNVGGGVFGELSLQGTCWDGHLDVMHGAWHQQRGGGRGGGSVAGWGCGEATDTNLHVSVGHHPPPVWAAVLCRNASAQPSASSVIPANRGSFEICAWADPAINWSERVQNANEGAGEGVRAAGGRMGWQTVASLASP